MYLPLFLKSDFSCLTIGGGQVATRKLEVLLDVSCKITVIAPQITEVIDRKVRAGAMKWLDREYRSGDCRGFELVIAATPVRDVKSADLRRSREPLYPR